MIAYLANEIGGDLVEGALLDLTSQCFAHAINLCEVYYHAYRLGGKAADAAINDLKKAGVVERNDFDENFWKRVSELKANHRASLADCCAVALTNIYGGSLLSADHHELDAIAASGVCQIRFIR